MMTANDLITDAIIQSGIIAQESGPYGSLPEYMTQNGFILLNDIIREWGGKSAYIPYNNEPIHFNFIPNQQSYTFGPSPTYFYNTQPIIDVITFTFFLDFNTNKINKPLKRITEFQYANILYRNNSWYPCEYLLRTYPNYSELIVQALPSQGYSATVICKQRLKPIESIFQDLEVQFPQNFLLCLKYRLMLDLMDSYGKEPSPAFIKKYDECLKNMLGSNKLDLTTQATENMARGVRVGNYFYGITGL